MSGVWAFRPWASPADKPADKNSNLGKKRWYVWEALLTKLLTKPVQAHWSEALNALFCVVSAVGIEPTTY